MENYNVQGLIDISHYAASKVSYIQGGGGNTSVKFEDGNMAVKASGCKLSQMAEKEGYVVVDYKALVTYFEGADAANPEFEKISGQVLKDSVIEQEGLKPLRPSVEAGFHSLLKKYVIHTHSAYTNILCCSAEGKEMVAGIIGDAPYIWLPYVNPGASLTLVMANAIKEFGQIPAIIFMENHGVIVTADTAEKSMELHELVNNKVRVALNLTEEFPTITLEQKDENQVVSHTDYIKDYFSKEAKEFEFIREKVLYPDQLVYLNNSVYKKDGSASDIYFNEDELVYKTTMQQAQVNEETFLAYLYVINTIQNKGMTLVSMTHEHQAFILGWESEAYRKSMLK